MERGARDPRGGGTPYGRLTPIDAVDVTCRVLGRTRTDTVELAVPLILTTQDLDAVASQVGVVARS